MRGDLFEDADLFFAVDLVHLLEKHLIQLSILHAQLIVLTSQPLHLKLKFFQALSCPAYIDPYMIFFY